MPAGAALRAAIARKDDYAEAHYMLGTILRQQGAPPTRSPSSAAPSRCSRDPRKRT